MPEIITHTDGTLWVACTKEEPRTERYFQGATVYHPDARVDYTSLDGADDHYSCPHCGASWWVEYDG